MDGSVLTRIPADNRWRELYRLALNPECFLDAQYLDNLLGDDGEPVQLPLLSRQIDAGGHLLVVSHADYPSWVPPEDRQGHGQFLKPEEEVEALGLLDEGWTVEIAETRTREVTAPDGSPAVLDDAVVLLRRD